MRQEAANGHNGKISASPLFGVQLEGLAHALVAFIVLSILEWFAYVGFLGEIPRFLPRYGWWLFYLNISIVSVGASIKYILTHKTKIGCMTGMMIGMTVGMQTGMMLGAVVGATNGFFTGAMVGLAMGCLAGAILGKCCGIMGIMEGLMAGVMGGTMGPMISVMMFSDHLLWFMPVYMLANLLILAGLTHMFYVEIVEGKPKINMQKITRLTYVCACIIVAGIVLAIMVYGPKSLLFST